MNINQTEKLIAYVRTHQCLYYRKDKDYKNQEKKDILWRKIARALNLTSDEAKAKWKNLKDCYTKYKKELTFVRAGQKRKYQNWSWAQMLSFLDCTLPRRTNALKSAETTNNVQSNDDLMNQVLSLGLPITAETLTPLPNPESPTTINQETPHPFYFGSETIETHSTSKIKPPEGDIDKIINYLKNKKPDAADLLFNSYAESFKKLKPRTQAELKLKLAQIFAEAELMDLDSQYEVAEKY